MSQALARWSDQVAVERIGGVPFRMYVERPRRLEQLLAFASRWGARPHVVQGERVLTFDDFRRLTAAKAKDLVRLGVGPGERVGRDGLEQRRLRRKFLGRARGRRRACSSQHVVERSRGC